MARTKETPRSGAATLDEAEDGALTGAADPGGADGENESGADAPHDRKPSWEGPVETGINGYRGSGG